MSHSASDHWLAIRLCLSLVLSASTGFAETAADGTIEAASESPVDSEERIRAKRWFEAGVVHAAAGEYLAAATAFEEAQALVPHPTTLLNLGLAYAAMGRSVEAVNALTQYLEQVPDDSTAAHRSAVLSKLKELSATLGEARFETSTELQALLVDGERADPNQPLKLNAGWHTASATSLGSKPQTVRFFVSPQRMTSVTLQLTPLPTLEIACAIPDVHVLRAGKWLGTTDGVTPLKVGRFAPFETYVLSREDYHPQRLDVGENTALMSCKLVPRRRSAQLFVTGTTEGARLLVDGRPFINGTSLPQGMHRLEVNQPGFHPHAATLHVNKLSILNVEPVLQPTKPWHDAYVAHAEKMRLIAGVTSISGGLLALASVGVLLNNTSRLDEMVRRGETQEATATCGSTGSLTATAESICTWDQYAYWGLGIGTTAVVTGAALWWFGPDPHRYANHRVKVGVSGRGVSVRSAF